MPVDPGIIGTVQIYNRMTDAAGNEPARGIFRDITDGSTCRRTLPPAHRGGPRGEKELYKVGIGEVDEEIERVRLHKDARRVLCLQKDLNFIPPA